MGNTLFHGQTNDKIYQLSGQFTTTVKNSVGTSGIDTNQRGCMYDGTSMYWGGAANQKLFITTGFTTTVADSQSTASQGYIGGACTDGTNMPWSEWFTNDKSYLYSGQVTGTIKDSQSTTGWCSAPYGASHKAGDYMHTGVSDAQLFIQDGMFDGTLQDSISAWTEAADGTPTDISFDGTNTPWSGDDTDKLYVQSGALATVIKNSQATGISPLWEYAPFGIEDEDQFAPAAGSSSPSSSPSASPSPSATPSASPSGTPSPGTYGEVEIQRGVVTFGASADTATDTITAVTTANAFARLTNTLHTSAFPDAGTTANKNNDDIGCRCELTDTTTVTFTRVSTGENADTRCAYEVWEYTGAGGGVNEFIVRYHDDITISASSASTVQAVGGISTLGNCVPFICGITNTGTGRTWDDGGVTAEMHSSPSNGVTVTRSGTAGTTIVTVAVVEFTGSNWDVQNNIEHTFAAAGANETETITTLVTTDAFIVPSHRTGGDLNLDEIGYNVWFKDVDEIYFRLRSGATTPTSHVCVVHVVENSEMVVEHLDSILGGGTDFDADTAGADEEDRTCTAVTRLGDAAIIATADCAGTGSAYPRAFWNYQLEITTNIQFWRARGGQAGEWAAQVIDFSGLTAGGTPSASPSASPSATPSASPSATPSASPSASPSESPSASPSESPSASPSATPSASPSATPSASPSESPSASPSPSATPSASPSASPSATPSASPSATPSASPSATPSASPSATPSASPSATPSASPSATPSASPSATPSASPSATPSASPSATPSASPSATPSASPSATPSASPSATPSASPSATPSASPSATPSASPSASVSASPSISLSASPSATPSASPSASVSASPSASPSVSPSASPSRKGVIYVHVPSPSASPTPDFFETENLLKVIEEARKEVEEAKKKEEKARLEQEQRKLGIKVLEKFTREREEHEARLEEAQRLLDEYIKEEREKRERERKEAEERERKRIEAEREKERQRKILEQRKKVVRKMVQELLPQLIEKSKKIPTDLQAYARKYTENLISAQKTRNFEFLLNLLESEDD